MRHRASRCGGGGFFLVAIARTGRHQISSATRHIGSTRELGHSPSRIRHARYSVSPAAAKHDDLLDAILGDRPD
jgi:hypothetical protein